MTGKQIKELRMVHSCMKNHLAGLRNNLIYNHGSDDKLVQAFAEAVDICLTPVFMMLDECVCIITKEGHVPWGGK